MNGLVKLAFQHHTKVAADEEQQPPSPGKMMLGGAAAAGAGVGSMVKGNEKLPFQTIYHGTAAKNKDAILREGLRPDKGGTGTDQFTPADLVFKSSKGSVHATGNRNRAEVFAKGFHPDIQEAGRMQSDALKTYMANSDGANALKVLLTKERAEQVGKSIYGKPMNREHSAVIKGKVPLTLIDRADYEADKYDLEGNLKMHIEPGQEQATKINSFQTTEHIPPEALKGGKTNLFKKIKYRASALPELLESYPGRTKTGLGLLGAGAVATGTGLGLAGYGGHQLLKNKEE